MIRRHAIILGAVIGALLGLYLERSTRPVLAQSWLRGVPFSCTLDGTGAALARCGVPPPGDQRFYITDVVAQSTTSTAGLFFLYTGTGTDCATGGAYLLGATAGGATARLAASANTVPPTVISFDTPLSAPTGKDLCAQGVVTNTLYLHVRGYIAP